MKQLYSGRYAFTAYQNVIFAAGAKQYAHSLPIKSECYLNAFETNVGIVAIATELYNNPGMSVDNGAEFLAEELVNVFNYSPAGLALVTRYTDKESYNENHSGSEKERLALVTFHWELKGNIWYAHNAQFSHITRARL